MADDNHCTLAGLPFLDALTALCDPDLVARYEQARDACPGVGEQMAIMFNDFTGTRRDQLRPLQDALRNALDALMDDFWARVESGEIIARGHPDRVSNPVQQLERDELRWLKRSPERDGVTFEANGRTWHRVLFYPRDEAKPFSQRYPQQKSGLALEDSEVNDPLEEESVDVHATGDEAKAIARLRDPNSGSAKPRVTAAADLLIAEGHDPDGDVFAERIWQLLGRPTRNPTLETVIKYVRVLKLG